MRRFLMKLAVGLAPFPIVVLGIFYFAHSKSDGRTARLVVERTYEEAKSSDLSEGSLCQREMREIGDRFDRVLRYGVVAEHWSWEPHTYVIELDVERERAVTREAANATAGPSNLYGYYMSPSATNVRLLRSAPRNRL